MTSVYLDSKLISGSFQNTTWGSHNMQIFWGLDPDTGPTFSSTTGSTIISNQSSGTVNFTFNGPSNNGGLSIAFCGAPRYSFTFFKPSGAEMQIYPKKYTLPNEGAYSAVVYIYHDQQFLAITTPFGCTPLGHVFNCAGMPLDSLGIDYTDFQNKMKLAAVLVGPK